MSNKFKKTKNWKIPITLLLLFIIAGSGYLIFSETFSKKGNFSTVNYYLDTVNEITLINIKESKSKKVLPKIDEIILNIHNTMSSQLESSEVSKINDNSGIKPVKVSDETLTVIKKSIYYSNLTSGKFDISIGPISSLWNIGTDNAKVPSEDEIKKSLPLVNYKNTEIDEKNKTVFLKEKGMKLDLGGIAKGYCADLVSEYLKSQGIKDAIINLGGNIYVMGKNNKGSDFSVGIQNPNGARNDSVGKITTTDMSIVTSGIYERFIEKNGKIYHHMLDPKTGYPFENNLNAVSIVSKKSIDGDALSTSTFSLGLEDGLKFVNSQDNFDAIFITKDKKIYLSDGLKGKFKLMDNSYTIAN